MEHNNIDLEDLLWVIVKIDDHLADVPSIKKHSQSLRLPHINNVTSDISSDSTESGPNLQSTDPSLASDVSFDHLWVRSSLRCQWELFWADDQVANLGGSKIAIS